MTENLGKLEEVLSKAGWLPFPVSLELPSKNCAFFTCGYATAGFILDSNAQAASLLWQPMQGIMVELRSNSLIPSGKDLYLVVMVPEISGELVPAFQQIVNDTYVCRKIVLEMRGRTLPEALAELPIFSTRPEAGAKAIQEAERRVAPRLPQELLDDLARRSATVVLERALAGSYRSEQPSDED